MVQLLRLPLQVLKPLPPSLHVPAPPPSRFFYASSACIYPEFKQLDVTVEGGGLKESDAWPAFVSGGGEVAGFSEGLLVWLFLGGRVFLVFMCVGG